MEGYSRLFNPSINIINDAEKLLSYVRGDILYARIDGTIIENEFVLMELELIEPDLFFDYHRKAREEFVEAFIDIYQSQF